MHHFIKVSLWSSKKQLVINASYIKTIEESENDEYRIMTIEDSRRGYLEFKIKDSMDRILLKLGYELEKQKELELKIAV